MAGSETMPPNDADGSRGEGHHEIVEVVDDDPACTPSSGTMRLIDFIPIYIPTVENGALSRSRRKRRFLDFLRAHPSKDWFLRSTFVGRRTRQQAAPDSDEGDDVGPGSRRRFRVPFVRKIKWAKLWSYAASWCRKPANLAMLVWLGFVAAGLLIVLMLMTGMLNGAIPDSERRKRWTEVANQILNALFTIMCLYQHPKIFHHLVLLLRWRDSGTDRDEVRKVYCKDGAARPRDRAHMLVVVALLHVTCAAQYYCCALFWSFSRRDRPDWALNIGYGLGTGCPVLAGLYAAYSPLGRKQPGEPATDTEESSSPSSAGGPAGEQGRGEDDEAEEIKIYNRRVVVSSPEWSGGVLDCCDDATVCAASACCTFCVFGWNMERLGLGNMYVHAFTFALLFAAPLLIFSVTALNVHDPDIRDIVVAAGVLCGFCGFLYGGFWRTQMRKRYKLPAGASGAVGAAVGDCARWLFCWSCALAQEVRTANFYDVEDDRFVVAVLDDARNRVLVPLPREASSAAVHHSRSMSCPPKIVDEIGGVAMSPLIAGVEMAAPIAMERSATYHPMRPPMPPVIQMDREAQ